MFFLIIRYILNKVSHYLYLMKKELKRLELKKLFKEFGFLKVDEEYKKELQALCGPEFNNAIQQMFKENPDMNLLFNQGANSFSSPGDNLVNKKELDKSRLIGIEVYEPLNIGIDLIIYIDKSYSYNSIPKIEISEDAKKLYRKIATKTHPDKVSNKYLNDLYLKAKIAYKANDLFTLYSICNDIDIDYDFPQDKISEFKLHIKNLKNNNNFIEQTYLWAWINEENDDIKKNILRHFISIAYQKT